ncbi:FAD/NAD(P)-binding domain-containing protein [Cryphonectria parasitica EP155]|uniref:FAD/NAD(P)-binding domain-containing protein n=1 Tax=Cryphonectria parasitica (strain ATCC 38755 / EP155) TaxID=660469 RepID=A0A9P4YAE1_CRYP1|nr:FAD/NAD(P)-binding domain-containing protein [Cryphonectria parasitica EP155]KAF3769433.1 FAD/NAD(P)-binding domain-containing protein [Cryphonectria parasitica EP155]
MESFRVIVTGGSVVGLVLANALEKAGIDYIVLEKREIAPHLGASISVLCQSARVFEQLGIWKRMLKESLPLKDRLHFDEHGNLFENTAVLRLIGEQTNRPFLFVERRSYIQTLYDNLDAKHKVRDYTGVVSFREDEDGVTVVTDKGEEIKGSILVGADGIHSTVKRLMDGNSGESDATGAEKLNDSFVATYRVVFGTSRNARSDDSSEPYLPGAAVHNVYYRGVSGIAAAGVEGLVFWFLFVKEDSPSRTPHCPRYTDEDAQRTIDKYGHLALGPGYTFCNLWESRIRASMVPLEEGVLGRSWNSGKRVVLMGDSVSKSTINPGLGGNTHIEGICNFVNELKPLLENSPKPTTEEIHSLFQKYEDKQRPRATACVNVSSYITRFEAMDTWYWRLARIISPWVPDSLKAKAFLNFISSSPILNFLPDPDREI